MKIHPLWFLCLAIRLLLALLIKTYGNQNYTIRVIFLSLLLFIGVPFILKGYYGSNKEYQIAKVFWHETRYTHGILYLLSAFYLYHKNPVFASVFVFTDVAFSILYRIICNK